MRHKGKQLALGHKDKEGLGVGIRSHVHWFPGLPLVTVGLISLSHHIVWGTDAQRRHYLPKDIYLIGGNVLKVQSGNP